MRKKKKLCFFSLQDKIKGAGNLRLEAVFENEYDGEEVEYASFQVSFSCHEYQGHVLCS